MLSSHANIADIKRQESKTSVILKLKAVMSCPKQLVVEHEHVRLGFKQTRHKNALHKHAHHATFK